MFVVHFSSIVIYIIHNFRQNAKFQEDRYIKCANKKIYILSQKDIPTKQLNTKRFNITYFYDKLNRLEARECLNFKFIAVV